MDEIFTIIAGVLHIGNVEFDGDDKVTIKNMDQIKTICQLLQLNEKNLVTSLTCECFLFDVIESEVIGFA